MNKTIRKESAVFSRSIEVDFQKNKKLLILINFVSLPLFALFYILFHYIMVLTGVTKYNNLLVYFKALAKLPLNANIIFLLSLLFILIVHELIHGLFFYIYTKDQPVIGFKSLYAYAGAPEWYIIKSRFLVISLSPLILMSTAGFILISFLTFPYASMVFLLITVNAAGSTGDIWISTILLSKPKQTYINDSGVSAVIAYN